MPGAPYNAADDLLGRNRSPTRRSRPYLLTEDRTWTYEEVAAGADAAGAGLLDLGARPGDRVLLATRDRPEFVMAFWGAIRAGLVAVPVAQGLSTDDLAFLLADSGATAIVCDPSSARQALPAAERAGATAILAGSGPLTNGARGWADVCGGEAPLEPAPTSEDDVCLWLYTSGTTGQPKGAMHRHRHLRAACDGLTSQIVHLAPDDVVLSVSKMYFAYGLGNSVYQPASAGASVVVEEGPAIPARIHEVLERTRPTLLYGVPAFLDGYVREPESTLPRTVRMVVSAGEALSEDLLQRFVDRFGVPPIDGLGSTEALHHFTSNRPDDVVPGSAGPPLEGYDVRILKRDGEPVPDGDEGELWVRGPTVMAGYWQRPDLTERTLQDGWLRTGDLATVVDGRVRHRGRLDDLMKLGGVWVAPREIEGVIRDHPAVTEAAVVAVDDGSGVPVLKAFVVVPSGHDGVVRELSRRCRDRLATFKVPKAFEVVEELPRTPTGKLKRFVLRERDRAGGGREA